MANDGDTNINSKILSTEESTSNKSFVKKVKSRVSGLLPSSLSRWFGSTESQVRYREESDDEEEESFRIQPPTKRIKPNDSTLTSLSNHNENIDVLPNKTQLNSVNHIDIKLTFPEPIAGPSGYNPKRNLAKGKSSLNKQLYTIQHDVVNGDKYSDSGESVTSGYSSMNVGNKDVVTENKNETVNDSFNKLQFSFNSNSRSNDRSLFSDRCTSPQVLNSSLSTRQPSFNSSIFGSPNFVDRTISSKRILNSPFYSGRTTYGGASAYGRTLASNEQKSSINRNSVQIKPINEKTNTTKSNTTLSKTARRILDTLEQYTTPITDAKKIPNPSIRKKYLNTNKPYPQRETKVPSNRELQVPTVPDLLKMKLKERLQDSTVSVRQIATSSKSVLNQEEYTIKTLESDSDKNTKHSNKIKNKISSVRQKNEPHRTVEEVKLPDIQLPISNLPKFDFSLPPIEPMKSPLTAIKSTLKPIKSTETVKTCTSTLSMVEKESKTEKSVETNKMESTTVESCSKDNNKTESNKTESKKSEHTKMTEFKFSDPVIIAENLKSIRAINNFIFSEPTSTKSMSTHTKEINKDESRNAPAKNNGECKKESTNSIFKVLNKDNNTNDLMAKFKPSNDTWECTICLIRNVDSKNKCAACESPRPQNKIQNGKPPPIGFGDKFKMIDGQWSCKVCLIVNPSNKKECVACETPKEGVKDAKTENIFAKKPEVKSTFSFGILPDKAQWECTTCLIRNKPTDLKCVACTAAKPTTNGSLKTDVTPKSNWCDTFKAPTDTWSCDICMIRNNNNDSKCVACQNPRPNIKATETTPSIGFDDKFKTKNDQWECDSCMVRNSQDKSRCVCCDALKPGAPNPDIPKEKTSISLFNFGLDPNAKTTISGFSFGIKPAETKNETPPPTNLIFGQNATNTMSTPTTFTFGIKATPEKVEEALKPSTNVIDKPKEPVAPAPIISTPQKQEVTNGFTINPPTSIPQITKTAAPTEERKEVFNLIPKVTESSTNIFNKELSTTKAFSFGAPPAPVSTSTTSIFGTTPSQTSSFNSTSEPTKTITFGTTNPQPIPSIAKAPTSSPFSNAKPNLFAVPPAETKAPSVFGSIETNKDEQPPAKMAHFSFGQAKKSDPNPPKFGFGALQPASSTNAFSFGQSAPSSVPNLNFSKPAEENGPNGAVSSVPLFNFGAVANTTPKTGFNFGASQPSTSNQATPNAATAVPPVNSGLFSFGAPANVTAPSTGGFNFNTSASTEFKPNFNFSSGAPPPTFSAQPNAGENKGRVIRRAIRRSHR